MIRPVGPAEVDAVADLCEEAYREVMGGLLTPDYLGRLRDVAGRAASAEVLVAVAGGDVLGTVTFVPGPGEWAEFDDPHTAGIRMLAVAPGAQGRGVGRALVSECLRRASAAGRSRVALHTIRAMVGARRLYEGMGFCRAPANDWTLPSGLVILGYERVAAAHDLTSGRLGT